MGVARTMLDTAGLSHELWPLAVRHTNWIRNRMPVPDNSGLIPYVEAYGTTFTLRDVRAFGCTTFQCLDEYQRRTQLPEFYGKLSHISRKMIYVGHVDESTAFLLWDPVSETLYRSGLPHFVESFHELGCRITTPMPKTPDFD